VLASSRILLTVSKLNAVWVAGIVSAIILAGAVVYTRSPGLGRRMVRVLGAAGALALLAAGVVAAAVGEREFVHHDPAHQETHTTDEPHIIDESSTTDGASTGDDHG